MPDVKSPSPHRLSRSDDDSVGTSDTGLGSRSALSIGQLADRTGVSVATLRAWENRHGFPASTRLPSGHRRYPASEVARVREVERRRLQAGQSLPAAIREVTGGAQSTESLTSLDLLLSAGEAALLRKGSVFAALREGYPHLPVQRLRKSTLTALSWAIEDEFCAKSDRAHLFGAFQHARHFHPSRRRWNELSRLATAAFVFADFDAVPTPETSAAPAKRGPTLIPLAPDSPLLREWAVVCDSTELPVVLTAWELPGQEMVEDRDRIFEAIWSIEPDAVRAAARVCATTAAHVAPSAAAPVLFQLADRPAITAPNLAALSEMFTRVLGYVEAHLTSSYRPDPQR